MPQPPDVRGRSAPAGPGDHPHQIHLQPPPRTTHKREKISQAFPMKSFPQALSTPSASWRGPRPPSSPGSERAAGCAALRAHSCLRRRAAPRAPSPPGRLGAPAQSTFLLPQAGRASGRHPG